jgi:hypothetical protein
MVERADADSVQIPITGELLSDVDTIVLISLDSIRTRQEASENEIAAVRESSTGPGISSSLRRTTTSATTPRRSSFTMVTARSHPNSASVAPHDRFSLGSTFPSRTASDSARRFCLTEIPPRSNASPTSTDWDCSKASRPSPHIRTCRTSNAVEWRRPKRSTFWPASASIRMLLPTRSRRTEGPTFDSLLQSRPGVFRGLLLVGDATLFTSAWRGVESLTRLWTNVLNRKLPGS